MLDNIEKTFGDNSRQGLPVDLGIDPSWVESEAKFSKLAQVAPVGIVLVDERGIIIEWNQRMEGITGFCADETLGKQIWELAQVLTPEASRVDLHDANRIQTLNIIKNGTKDYEGKISEFKIQRKDQQIRTINVTFFPIETARGFWIGAITSDVTEQQQSAWSIQKQTGRAEALARLASKLNSEPELEQILDTLCDEIKAGLKVEIVFLARYDEKNDDYKLLKLCASAISPRPADADLLPPYVLNHLHLINGKPLLIPDIHQAMHLEEHGAFGNTCTRTLLASGLFHNNKRIGVFGVLSWKVVREFSQDEITLLQIFADQAAAAIEHAQLFQEVKMQAKFLQLINEITQMALYSGDLKGLFSLLAQRVVDLLEADGCYITLWDPKGLIPFPFAGVGQNTQHFMGIVPTDDELTVSKKVLELRHAIFSENLNHSGLISERLAHRFGDNAILALPLILGEQKLGAILIEYRQPHTFILQKDFSRWEEMASQISLAVSKVTSIEKEKQRRHEAETIQKATAALAASLNLDEVLEIILNCIEQVVPFKWAWILLSEDDHLKIAAAKGGDPSLSLAGIEIDRSFSLIPVVETSVCPIVVPDSRQDPRCRDLPEFNNEPFLSWMGVPLVTHDHRIGILALAHHQANIYSSDHARLIQAFADQASVAIENARLFEQVRTGRERMRTLSRKLVEVQESERRFLARELHDEIGQMLTGLQFSLETCKRLPPAELIESLAEAQTLVRDLMSQVRELSLNLHPTLLDDLGLSTTLDWHFNRFQAQTGIQVHSELYGIEQRYPREIELTVFRVIQEAMTNTARHAGVDQVTVTVSGDENALSMCVEDQGRGFDPEIIRDGRSSLGVTGMRERTNLVGGIFGIESKPGSGTRVEAIFPTGQSLERRKNTRKNGMNGS